MMRVIIAGGRDFNDYDLLLDTLDHLLQKGGDIEIVSGGARGADALGERYAEQRSYPLKLFPAAWKTEGRSAGYLRNARMAEYADVCVCFWDGRSSGTRHMINLATEAKLALRVIRY